MILRIQRPTNSIDPDEAAYDKPSHLSLSTMLQIRNGNWDSLVIISLISPQNKFCDPSLEPSCQDGSNEGSQHMFSLINMENYLLNYPPHPLLSGALIW